jgi:hypothetical protein
VLPPHRVTALTSHSLTLLESYCAALLLQISSHFVKSRCRRLFHMALVLSREISLPSSSEFFVSPTHTCFYILHLSTHAGFT